jgi:hypothetical protein
MLNCSFCHHKEVIGAIFCSECGTQLIGDNAEVTPIFQGNSITYTDDQEYLTNSTSSQPVIHETGVSLYIIDTGETLPLEGKMEFTLGRNSEGQSIVPDIDLTPFRGYELGVSRVHTSIRIEDNFVSATDLSSANGTRINGQEIPSNTPQRLEHGDIITLGKLKIQILIHR